MLRLKLAGIARAARLPGLQKHLRHLFRGAAIELAPMNTTTAFIYIVLISPPPGPKRAAELVAIARGL
jgi:hypothetical protein